MKVAFVKQLLDTHGPWASVRWQETSPLELLDVWPGAVVASVLFVIVQQAFPIYLRFVGGSNRYGVALGLLSLMVVAFYAIAHVILFGAYINATWQRHRQSRERLRQRASAPRDPMDGEAGDRHHGPFVPADVQRLQREAMDHRIR